MKEEILETVIHAGDKGIQSGVGIMWLYNPSDVLETRIHLYS